MLDITRSPFPVTVRELWLPRAINGNASLPSSRYNGHGLTLTGARKGTTADGVHFDGTVNSSINFGAIHNAAAKLWISFRFKLDQDHTNGSPDTYVFHKVLAWGTDDIFIFLANNGRMYFRKNVGGGLVFSLDPGITTWNAGQWYHVLASISDVNAARLRVDNAAAITNPDVTAAPNGGNLMLGSSGGLLNFRGVIADFVCGTDDLSQAAPDEEYELYAGIPPADAVNFCPLDEGRGLGAVAIDRGSGGNNGTLDTSCSWAYGECKHPVLSLDGINDRGVSSAGVDISGDVTALWAGKMKSTYSGLAGDHSIFQHIVGANRLHLYYRNASNNFWWYVVGGGVAGNVAFTNKPSIDQYWILLGTSRLGGEIEFFINGSSVGLDTGVGAVAPAATSHFGATSVPGDYDISKPLFAALIDGAFTDKQVLAFSRWLDNVLGMGVGI